MIKFNKPEILNGNQLVDELKQNGIIVNEKTSPFIDGNGDFWLDIPTKDKTKAEPIVAAHIGVDQSKTKAAQRQAVLNRLGITEEEARILLGGN